MIPPFHRTLAAMMVSAHWLHVALSESQFITVEGVRFQIQRDIDAIMSNLEALDEKIRGLAQ